MSQLEHLLQQCTVKLTLPDRSGWGTGFFVAPGWILTCAHVVKEAKGEPIQVRWQNQENWAQAVVERSIADPYDLALLRVTLPANANPPCVYLDEEMIRSRDPLYLFGYPDQDFPNGCPVTFNCEGLTGDEPALIKFALGQVRPGMSGSPLLNQRTGKVCGIVKFTRDRSFDLGGGAIPAHVILEQFPQLRDLQQEFHGGDRRWGDLMTEPSGIDFQPYLKAIARLYSQQSHLYTPTDALLTLEARSVEQQDIQQPDQKRKVEPPFPVITGLRKYALGEKREHVLLAGRPGSGKSTVLQQLTVALAEEGQVPVLVQLKHDRTVPELIQDEFRRAKQKVTPEQIEDWLLADQLILLLDGVNEIPNDGLRGKLARFRENNSTVPMIFTTRDLAVGGDPGIGKCLEMKPLSEPQMHKFVEKYLPEHGEQLLVQLRGRLREIAETPLLLKMLCDVFKQTGEIPQNKGELFQKFDRDYERLKKDIEYVPVSENFWEFKSEVLQHLAFSMIQADVQKPAELWLTISKQRAQSLLETWLHQRGVVDAPTKAKMWLKDLCKHHLLQDAVKPEEIEFHHQLFQEYYAAEYLLQLLPVLTDEQLKRDYLNYLKWTEAIALMLSVVDQKAQVLRVVKLALDIDLRLGARLVGSVKLDFQEHTLSFLTALKIPELLKIRLLGNAHSDSAISLLTTALSEQDTDIRSAAVNTLGQIGTEKAAFSLLKGLEDKEADVVYETVIWLQKLAFESLIPKLIKMTNTLDEYAKGKTGKIIEILLDQADILEGLQPLIESDKTIEDYVNNYLKIKELFSSPKNLIIEEQGHIEKISEPPELNISLNMLEEAINLAKLIESLSHQDFDFTLELPDGGSRDRFLNDLNYRLVSKLRVLVKSPNLQICELSFQLAESAMSLVDKVVKDLDWRVRERGVILIGEVTICLYNSKDNCPINERAQEVLKRATLILLTLSEDSNEYVRGKVIYALADINTQSAADTFRRALQDSEFSVRIAAAAALGEIKDEQATDSLLELLNDEVLDVRDSAANALGKISQKTSKLTEHLPDLVSRITEDSEDYIERLVVNIQNRCQFYNYEIAQGLIPPGKPIALFFSYAPNDEDLRDELEKHLSILKREGVITSWDNRQILPGDEREQVISDRLNTADIILLLISPDSMSDDTCYDIEIRRAMERHQAGEALVIPILLRPVDWTGALFSQLTVLPKNRQPVTKWDNRDEAFQAIAEGIREGAIALRKPER